MDKMGRLDVVAVCDVGQRPAPTRAPMRRIGVLKEHLGELTLAALDCPDEVNQFKTDSEYAEDVEIATMHRVLETLRAAMNWGMAQTPPLFNRSPFHRFGVRLNKKSETARDRRLTRDEEKRLLDAALQKMNTPEHQNVGALLHDRIIGALELCCRRGEMRMALVSDHPSRRPNDDSRSIMSGVARRRKLQRCYTSPMTMSPARRRIP